MSLRVRNSCCAQRRKGRQGNAAMTKSTSSWRDFLCVLCGFARDYFRWSIAAPPTQVTITMCHRLLLVGLGLLLSVGLDAGAADAPNWPRFRGPNGAGVSIDKNVPLKWGAKKGSS